jgi:hypothetical protein
MVNEKKKRLGQFYTTNHKYILQNFYIPNNVKTIIEPFEKVFNEEDI